METVITLTKEDCLYVMKRFTARRGLPENIYSDNSRTFNGIQRAGGIHNRTADKLVDNSSTDASLRRSLGSRNKIHEENFLQDCGDNKDVFWEFHNLDHSK